MEAPAIERESVAAKVEPPVEAVPTPKIEPVTQQEPVATTIPEIAKPVSTPNAVPSPAVEVKVPANEEPLKETSAVAPAPQPAPSVPKVGDKVGFIQLPQKPGPKVGDKVGFIALPQKPGPKVGDKVGFVDLRPKNVSKPGDKPGFAAGNQKPGGKPGEKAPTTPASAPRPQNRPQDAGQRGRPIVTGGRPAPHSFQQHRGRPFVSTGFQGKQPHGGRSENAKSSEFVAPSTGELHHHETAHRRAIAGGYGEAQTL